MENTVINGTIIQIINGVGAMLIEYKEQLMNAAGYLPKEEYESFLRAIDFADHAHQGQKRATGEPYITHPYSVCKILLDYKADVTTLISSLLHDVAEDTHYSIEDIEQRFGQEVSRIVDGLTKFDKGLIKKEEYSASNFEKLLSAAAQDIRVAIVKIADRLHNIRTLAVKKVEKQVPYANETLVFFSPLAKRLGLIQMQKELEEFSFQYVNPAKYKGVVKLLNNHSILFNEFFNSFKEKVENNTQSEIQMLISWYAKPMYESYSLLQEGSALSDINTIEVLTNSTLNCYTALGIIHGLFKPVENQFQDNIAIKKSLFVSNLTTMVSINGIQVKVEIKNGTNETSKQPGVFTLLKSGLSSAEIQKFSTQLFKDSISNVKCIANTPNEFYDLISFELLQNDITVFTPKMDTVALPEGSTALDFAFSLNPEIAKNMSSVKVNGQQKPLNAILNDMDIVEIKVENEPMVQEDWLNHAHTSKAQKEIGALFFDLKEN